MRSKAWLVAIVICGTGTLALGQRTVAPPPRPAESGPSLAVTMQFIQENLNAQGKLNYAAYTHDNIAGKDWANQLSVEASNVVANPAICRIAYHWKATKDGSVAADTTAWILLRDVQDIVVMTGEQNQNQVNAAGGFPAYDVKINPPFFVLRVQRKGNIHNEFDFIDQDMANRVAKAMVHAVELCGGGKKEPF